MIRFACPTCKSVLQSPAEKAGDKVACPKCGQGVRIPNPVKPVASNENALPRIQAQHKTSTGQPEPPPPVFQKEVQDVEREAFEPKRAIRKRRTSRAGSGCLLTFGVFLCIVGCLITLAYWLIYDTTTRGDSFERVHNLGLMNNRIVGTIVGIGMALGGLIVSLGDDLLDSITRLRHLLDRKDDES